MFKKLIYLASILMLSLAGNGWSQASNPNPADGAVHKATWASLSWQPGDHAVSYDIYVGENYDDVKNGTGGTFRGNQSLPFFIVGFPDFPYSSGLVPGTTYYWRVDEFDALRTYNGAIWSFTVGAPPPHDGAGKTIYVDAVTGNDRNDGLTPQAAFATIQKGIDAAADGGVVLVYPGLYEEEISFMGKKLTVQGVAISPAGVPVLHNPGDFAVSFHFGEGPDSILKNFIITDSFMGVFIVASSPTISNLTIVANKYGVEAYAGSEPDISNTILWSNTGGDLFGCRARYSCVERGGEGTITADPLFADPENGDYHIRSERGRYWPQFDIWVLDKATSPCVDAGDPNMGTLYEPMPHGNRINIGAYGGTTEASLSPSEQPSPVTRNASNPYPADGAVDVERSATLQWTPGANAVLHDVYFGNDRDAVANADTSDTAGTYRGRQAAASYAPPEGLRRYPSYYWRIDEVDSQGNKTKGDVWTFTVIVLPPKGRTCFTAETGVWLDGVLVPISKATVGRRVGRAVEDLLSLLPCLGEIETVQAHKGTFTCYDVLLGSGNRISVAENHYFLTDCGQWVSLHDLKAGMRLKTAKGPMAITAVVKRAAPYAGEVYNLKVNGSHRYLVGQDAIIVRDY